MVISAAGLLLPGMNALARQDEILLAVQPVLTEQETRRVFQPLADFISMVTGKRCVIGTRPNFLAYWDTVRKGESYDLVLDEAHFTDYRVRKLGYEILVKAPDTVTYTLISRNNNPVVDPAELVGRRIATLGMPSIGAARLTALFPNPLRQPMPIEVESAGSGLELLLAGRVDAAILPTPVVNREMSRNKQIRVVMTTEPIPNVALSASPRLDPALRERIRRALLEADNNSAGREMLARVGFRRFDPATPAIYAGHANVLKEYWGF